MHATLAHTAALLDEIVSDVIHSIISSSSFYFTSQSSQGFFLNKSLFILPHKDFDVLAQLN